MAKKTTDLLSTIRIILVGTSHTGNIGSAARAMKTMGLSRLYLVNPLAEPDQHAFSLASGAADILDNATFCQTLSEAVSDCQLIVGASARFRSLAWPNLSPRECGEKVAVEAEQSNAALVFGRERSGLTNDELQQCHYHVTIPANPAYSSLNLAMSVQILAYEIRMGMAARLGKRCSLPREPKVDVNYPDATELAHLYHHLEQTLLQIGFINPAHPGQIMNKLRRLFSRARLESSEVSILRGVFTAIHQKIKSH